MAEMGKRNDGGERLTDEDLLTEVLCKLPVKYILRCKAVSKTWYSLISSPSFVKSHYQSNSPGDLKGATLIVKLYEDDEYPEEDGSYSLFQLGGGCDDFLAHLKFPFSKEDRGSNRFIDIYIWNPATKQSKLIPPPTQYANPGPTRYGRRVLVIFGFGFDPIGFEFKVVRVVYSDKVSIFSEVYSAKRDAWRKIETEVTDCPNENKYDICLHGFLFARGDNGMMAFNLNKEVFVCHIEFPGSCILYDARIADYKDSISVISKCEEVGEKINLWTLDDEACLHGGGVKASWTFKLSIDVGESFDRVPGFFNSECYYVQGFFNNEFLLEAEVLFSYDFDNKVGRCIRRVPSFNSDVFKYKESLLSVAGSKLVQWSDDEDVNEGNSFESEDYNEESRVDSEDDNEETVTDSEDDEKSNINGESGIDSEDDE